MKIYQFGVDAGIFQLIGFRAQNWIFKKKTVYKENLLVWAERRVFSTDRLPWSRGQVKDWNKHEKAVFKENLSVRALTNEAVGLPLLT